MKRVGKKIPSISKTVFDVFIYELNFAAEKMKSEYKQCC